MAEEEKGLKPVHEPPTSKEIARSKLAAALKTVEDAQRTIDKASEGLSVIDGLGREWDLLRKISMEIQEAYSKLSARLQKGKFDLDDMTKARMAKGKEV